MLTYAEFLANPGTNTPRPMDVDTNWGEPCPTGNYCPEGSWEPTPCPTGTYNPDLYGKSVENCKLCEINTYNDEEGQQGCQPCGNFASSGEGAITCKCIGRYRSFGKSDNSCRCQTRFVFREIDGSIQEEKSSNENCIPLVFDRCDLNIEVLSPNGTTCLPLDCSSDCPKGVKGVRSQATGVCTCKTQVVNADGVCN